MWASFAAVMSLVLIVVEPNPVPGLDATQRQDAETALYLAGFAVLLPLALVVGPRLADRLAAARGGAAMSALAALLTAGFAGALIAARLADLLDLGGGPRTLLAAVAAWAVAAALALRRAAQPRPWPLLDGLGRHQLAIWCVAGAAQLGTVLTVTDLTSLNPLPVVLGIAALPAVLALYRCSLPRPSGRVGLALDVAVTAVLLLVVPDLVLVNPSGSFLERYVSSVVQFHHDFLLGPANQILGGGTMLVDTAAQYGVGSIYFLAGWFNLTPIGYGTFALLDGLLTALYLAAGYGLLRFGRCPRALSVAAVVLAVAVLVYNRDYPVGGLPQEGPLRFGLPLAALLAIVAAARWPRHARVAQAVTLGVLGLASIWALEAFAYTLATLAAVGGFQALERPPGDRLRWLGRQALWAGGACVTAHLALAGFTLARSGELPDWGQYFAYLNAFLLKDLGDFTYDFSRWSAGVAVAAAYTASAAALVLVLRRAPRLLEAERLTLLALAGTTTYGILLFSYLVDRSRDHVLPYVSYPALLAAALWLALVLRQRARLPASVPRAALVAAVAVSTLLVAVAWSSLGPRFKRSPLAHAAPGGDSLADAKRRLWRFPAIEPQAPQGERLVRRYMPGESRTLVLVKPDLDTEVLMRSERANALPLAHPWGDTFVTAERVPGLRQAVRRLPAGRRLLVDDGMLDALRAARRAGQDPLSRFGPTASPVQVWTLAEIEQRFRLRPVRRSSGGFAVFELEPR